MALSGTFSTMPFPDLLQWLGEARRSGTLTVSLDSEERYLRVREGQLIALGSDDPRSRDLARLVLARGLIDEVRLKRVIEGKERSRRSLRAILVDDGHVPAAALHAALRAHAKDVVLQSFLWYDGRFLFSDAGTDPLLDEAAPPDAELPIEPPISTREVLMDGMRRLDEWKRIAEVIPSDYTMVHAVGRAPDLPILELLADCAEPLAVGELFLRVTRPRFEVIQELFEAWHRGLLAIDSPPQQIAKDRKASPIDMLVHTARTLLEEKQFDEATALLRSALDLDPYHAEAKQLLHRARADQLEDMYHQFPPYRVPIFSAGPDRLQAMALSPRERFLLSRMDGRWDIGALCVMTPLGELETLRALKKFHHAGLVVLR
ncbi:MAG: DUF4388 domain-containing protein [Deltaproteobacteria bacterium]|nr:DUF4388 domain-containing protein [Deltaproteobacteria bacterium]